MRVSIICVLNRPIGKETWLHNVKCIIIVPFVAELHALRSGMAWPKGVPSKKNSNLQMTWCLLVHACLIWSWGWRELIQIPSQLFSPFNVVDLATWKLKISHHQWLIYNNKIKILVHYTSLVFLIDYAKIVKIHM